VHLREIGSLNYEFSDSQHFRLQPVNDATMDATLQRMLYSPPPGVASWSSWSVTLSTRPFLVAICTVTLCENMMSSPPGCDTSHKIDVMNIQHAH